MKKEKNKKINTIIWIVDIIAICLIVLILYFLRTNMLVEFPWDNYVAKARVVVIRVDEHLMLVQEIENDELKEYGLDYLGFTKKGNVGYKMGQELLVYYNGYMEMFFPGGFGNVGKIKILKEKSDLEIPLETLRYAYSSRDKLYVYVNDISKEGITFTIIDRNEIHYDYSSSEYHITTQVKNPNYTGKPGYYDGIETENSTSAYIAPEPEYIQKDITKDVVNRLQISKINKEETVKTLTADLQDEISKFKATKKIIRWKELIGELGERRI